MTDQPQPETPEAAPVGVAAPAEAASVEETAGPPWQASSRPRGLDSYFPAGGEDEATEERRRDDQRMVRYLVIFIALLIGIPTLLTILGFVSEFLAARGGG